MKVFKVWVDKCDYDTYDSFVCVANSESYGIVQMWLRDWAISSL